MSIPLMLTAWMQGGSFWMPEQASGFAPNVDGVFYFIFWLSAFFFVLIVGLMTVFVIRYRYKPGVEADNSITHNTKLEIFWTVVPSVLVLVIFYLGFEGYVRAREIPKRTYPIQVLGRKWSWSFTYPNGVVSSELHVPLGTPVSLTMTSNDVIHSLWVPAFRVKMDVVPGRYSKLWFQATKTGEFPLLCTEYCGTGHSNMRSKVIVHEPGEFKQWLESAAVDVSGLSPAEAGAKLFAKYGCGSCHNVKEKKRLIGPPLRGLFGHEVKLAGGGTVVADENYLRESILDPAKKIVEGYPPVMTVFKGMISDDEITKIIEYLKSLKD